MNEIAIVNSYYTPEEWDPSELKTSSFRKATTNMRYAFNAIQKLLLPLDMILTSPSVTKAQIGFFVGTSHGELEATLDFLKMLAPHKVPNPIHFQNSLHNSILGFVAQHFSLVGPGMTLTNRYFSGEDALAMALQLLQTQTITMAIVLGVDTIPRNFKNPFLSLYSNSLVPPQLKDGSSALFLANSVFLKEHLKITKQYPMIKSVECCYLSQSPSDTETDTKIILKNFYDSNGIEMITKHIRSSSFEKCLTLIKPDKTFSKVFFFEESKN